MVITCVFAVVIVAQPDFSTAFILCLVIFGMWICGEMRWLHLFGLVFAAVPAGIVGFVLQPYRIKRLLAFIEVSLGTAGRETLQGKGWDLHQSLIAVGSGGAFGVGLGESVQKRSFASQATPILFSQSSPRRRGLLGRRSFCCFSCRWRCWGGGSR